MGETWELIRENPSAEGTHRQDLLALLGFRRDSVLLQSSLALCWALLREKWDS